MRISRPDPSSVIMKLFSIKPGEEITRKELIREEVWQQSIARAKVWEYHHQCIADGTWNSEDQLKVYNRERNKFLGIKK